MKSGPGKKKTGGELLKESDGDNVTRVVVLHKNTNKYTIGNVNAREEKEKKNTENKRSTATRQKKNVQ